MMTSLARYGLAAALAIALPATTLHAQDLSEEELRAVFARQIQKFQEAQRHPGLGAARGLKLNRVKPTAESDKGAVAATEVAPAPAAPPKTLVLVPPSGAATTTAATAPAGETPLRSQPPAVAETAPAKTDEPTVAATPPAEPATVTPETRPTVPAGQPAVAETRPTVPAEPPAVAATEPAEPEQPSVAVVAPVAAPPAGEPPAVATGPETVSPETLTLAATRPAPTEHVTLPPEDQVNVRVQFDFDSAAINADQKPKLRTFCKVMDEMHIRLFRIVGHTDASGSAAYNQKLSLLRAEEVKRFFTDDCGIASDRLEAIGVGEQFLADPNDPKAGENRRVEFQAIS